MYFCRNSIADFFSFSFILFLSVHFLIFVIVFIRFYLFRPAAARSSTNPNDSSQFFDLLNLTISSSMYISNKILDVVAP